VTTKGHIELLAESDSAMASSLARCLKSSAWTAVHTGCNAATRTLMPAWWIGSSSARKKGSSFPLNWKRLIRCDLPGRRDLQNWPAIVHTERRTMAAHPRRDSQDATPQLQRALCVPLSTRAKRPPTRHKAFAQCLQGLRRRLEKLSGRRKMAEEHYPTGSGSPWPISCAMAWKSSAARMGFEM
jgi:hypothetical protein